MGVGLCAIYMYISVDSKTKCNVQKTLCPILWIFLDCMYAHVVYYGFLISFINLNAHFHVSQFSLLLPLFSSWKK